MSELYTSLKLSSKITPKQTTGAKDLSLTGYKVTMEAKKTDNNPAYIFVYQKEPYSKPVDGNVKHILMFSHLASPSDLTEYKLASVATDTTNDVFYLSDKLEAITRSHTEAETIVKEIKQDVKKLIDHNKMLASNSSTADETTY